MGSLKKQFIFLIGLLFVVSISSHELLHDYYEDLQYEFEEECQYCANETLDEPQSISLQSKVINFSYEAKNHKEGLATFNSNNFNSRAPPKV